MHGNCDLAKVPLLQGFESCTGSVAGVKLQQEVRTWFFTVPSASASRSAISLLL